MTEDLCERKGLWSFVIRPPSTEQDMEDIATAFDKVFEHLDDLMQDT